MEDRGTEEETKPSGAGSFFFTSHFLTGSNPPASSSMDMNILYDAASFVARSEGIDLFLSEKNVLPMQKAEIDRDDQPKSTSDNCKSTESEADSQSVANEKKQDQNNPRNSSSNIENANSCASDDTSESGETLGCFNFVAKPRLTPVFRSFDVILAGDGGVGKTTWVKKLKGGEFEKNYAPTFGYNVLPLQFTTNRGSVYFSVRDTAGHEKMGEQLRDGYYISADAAIIMFDVTSRISYKNIPNWYRDIVRVTDSIPIVITGNKVDVRPRLVHPKMINFHRKKNLPYYDISAKTNFNLDSPFLYLARKLLRDPGLRFEEIPDIMLEEAPVEEGLLDQYRKELEAIDHSLPIEDDDF